MEGKPGPPLRFGHKNRFAVLIADRVRPAEPHDYRFIYGKRAISYNPLNC
jgi:hypothetical protein